MALPAIDSLMEPGVCHCVPTQRENGLGSAYVCVLPAIFYHIRDYTAHKHTYGNTLPHVLPHQEGLENLGSMKEESLGKGYQKNQKFLLCLQAGRWMESGTHGMVSMVGPSEHVSIGKGSLSACGRRVQCFLSLLSHREKEEGTRTSQGSSECVTVSTVG